MEKSYDFIKYRTVAPVSETDIRNRSMEMDRESTKSITDGGGDTHPSRLLKKIIFTLAIALVAFFAGISVKNQKPDPDPEMTEETTNLTASLDGEETTVEIVSETKGIETASETATAEIVSETAAVETVTVETTEEAVSATVIEWTDAGMEQYIRAALDCPDGDITSADLEDVKVLRLGSFDDGEKVVILKNTAADPGNLKDAGVSANPDLAEVEIHSLADLKWMPNLEKLEIGGLEIEDISTLNEMKSISYLFVHDTEVVDISVLSEMISLKYLYLNNITGIVDISAMSGMTNLSSLGLYGDAGITDISALSGLVNLTYVNLSYTGITDISALSGMTNLTELCLKDTGITDISVLSSLQKLNKLVLSNCTEITNFDPLSEMINLTILHLTDTKISDLSVLSKLTNLEYLYLDNTPITDVNAVKDLVKLKDVSVEGCTDLKDISPLHNLPNLEVTPR